MRFWNKIMPSSIVCPKCLLVQGYRVDFQVVLRNAQKKCPSCSHSALAPTSSRLPAEPLENVPLLPLPILGTPKPSCAPGTTSKCSKSSNYSWSWSGPTHMKRPEEEMGRVVPSPTSHRGFDVDLPISISYGHGEFHQMHPFYSQGAQNQPRGPGREMPSTPAKIY